MNPFEKVFKGEIADMTMQVTGMKPDEFIFEKVFQSRSLEEYAQESGNNDPFYVKCKAMEAEFSDLVDVMRQAKHLPLPRINTLLTLLWRLVGNKITPVAMTQVPTISFWTEIKHNKSSVAYILCPDNWYDMLRENPHFQMGALTFAASQAKDYWNHKFVPGSHQQVKDRAWSSEAELLHYFARTAPKFSPNEYQKKLMEEFPKGIDSVSSHYEGRDYAVGAYPPFPVNPNRSSL